MARKKRDPLEEGWGGVTRGERTPPPDWANDRMGWMVRTPRGTARMSVRDSLLAREMEQALARGTMGALGWVLKQVVAHEIARIKANPPGYFLFDFELSNPAKPDRALALLGLTVPDANGQAQLLPWIVEEARRRHPGRQSVARDKAPSVWL